MLLSKQLSLKMWDTCLRVMGQGGFRGSLPHQQTARAVAIALGFPFHLNVKILFLKILHTSAARHGDIQWELT